MSLKMGWGMFLKNTPSSGVMILTNHNAWERLKSLEDSHVDKKKESIRLLLEKAAAADTNYFQLLNTEAQALTKIGNDYQIRHSEKRTQAVDDPYQIDYFFERLYALIRLLLRKSGRHR